uniref:Patatin-like phospholipase n=1 Tax=Marseillevirus LCMAC101 TaxID=2506602 RepID=A0A481YT77_9VIRU|nr:MAG: patatin-like phospholipase [Marseillevirus LCMAC101]
MDRIPDLIFETIVLSGGGTKGIYILGSLHCYYEKGKYVPSEVKTYIGTSVGSVISLLLVCGYLPIEIFKNIYLMDSFFDIRQDNISFLDVITNVFKNMGLIPIDSLISKIENMIKIKLNVKEIPTLEQLYETTKKELICVTTNISERRVEYFNHKDHPNLKCTDAVKMSCNIPLMFQKIRYNNCYYVDGAMVNNFAVDHVDKKTNKILGIYLPNNDPPSDEGLGGYLGHIILSMQDEMYRVRSRNIGDNITVIVIYGEKNDGMMEVNISSEKKMKMFLDGIKVGKIKDSEEFIQVEGLEDPNLDKFKFDPKEWNAGWSDDSDYLDPD